MEFLSGVGKHVGSAHKLTKLKQQFADLVTEPPAVRLNEEWFRLQTFGGWPFPRPRKAELAKAGLYYAPTEANKDRCECFACGKVFMEWEPEDDPLEAHRLNVPDCPFIKSGANNVPLPSAYTAGGEDKPDKKQGSVSSYVSALKGSQPAGAAPKQAAAPQVRAQVQFPEPPELPRHPVQESDSMVPASIAPQRGTEGLVIQNENEVDELVVRLQKGTKKGKRGKTSQVLVLENQMKKREEFMAQQRTEWTAIQLLIENSTKVLREIWERQLGEADDKLQVMTTKMAKISKACNSLSSADWLEKKRGELRAVQDAVSEATAAKKRAEEELEELGKRSAAEKRDLTKLKNKEDLLKEYEEQYDAKVLVLKELENKMAGVQAEVDRLNAVREQVAQEIEANRNELKANVDSLKKEKMQVQSELVDTRDALERHKTELELYDIKLRDWNRREEAAMNLDKELMEREREVIVREREVKLREELLGNKEGELRQALEATRQARRTAGHGRVPMGQDGPVMEGGDDMWEPEDDELETKREELLGMISM
mmetsp:Transcript_7097/g.16231  ORF Transcript_7097/g.16231 Transcript_7097/m.16231 type:complete len:542 (-) Transcript_7097:455-2080(-)